MTLRTHEIFTLLSLSAAYTAAICLQLLPTAGFCRNGDKLGNDQSQDLFQIAAAFGVVNFAENEFKISVCCLFGAVRDAIQ